MSLDPAQFSLDALTPRTIYTPHDANELAQMLAQCNAEKRAVVPWGGGTLQHLGHPPTRYDAAICTTNLNQVIDYAYDDLTATFGAGMTLAEIERVLAEHGQFLPIDVPHPERATIGGVLATGMNGPLRLRYGPVRDFLIGNRFATVEGHVIKAGSKVVKNVAGYELHKVQVGAFGTLGILSEATFKVFPRPAAETTLWASFDDLRDACAVISPLWRLPTPPLALELFDRATGAQVYKGAQGKWFIAARFGGPTATIASARETSAQTAREHQARVEIVEEGMSLWRTIADLPAQLRETQPGVTLLRASIPPKELFAALRSILDLASIHQLAPPRLFAHAALATIYACSVDVDASPHLARESAIARDDRIQETRMIAFVRALRAQLHERGGHLMVVEAPTAIKAQAGVWGDVGPTLKLMQSIKRQFDPNNILNPGRFVGGI